MSVNYNNCWSEFACGGEVFQVSHLLTGGSVQLVEKKRRLFRWQLIPSATTNQGKTWSSRISIYWQEGAPERIFNGTLFCVWWCFSFLLLQIRPWSSRAMYNTAVTSWLLP
jgi:hypothetical protein